MTQEIPKIVESIENTIKEYTESLKNYSDEQFLHKQEKDIWSLGEMFEHLEISSKYVFLANVKRILERRKGQEGGERNEKADNIFKHNSFPPIKVKVPGNDVIELNPKSKEHYQKAFQEILDSAKAFEKQVEADAGTYKINHPVLGFLNAKEWFSNLDMHFRHHLRQKKELEQYAKIS